MVQYIIATLPILLESFPISSSGHAKLLSNWYAQGNYLSAYIPQYFDHFLHGPIAVTTALFFFNRWFFLCMHIKRTWPYLLKIFFFGFITEFITLIWYVAYSFVGDYQYNLPLGFLVTSLLLLSLIWCPLRQEKKNYRVADAGILGMAQGFALFPGVSRFATTFACARWLGFSDKKSFELSFLIEWPISFAGFLKGSYSLYSHHQLDLLSSKLLFAMLLASMGAWVGFCLVSRIVHKKKLWLFSPYVACIGILAALINR